GRPLACNTSIGIALAPDNGEDAANIIKNADIALYNAKRRKRGDYAFFESATDERAQKRKQIGMALREALAKKELFLEFQPIYATHDRQVNGFEALVRWTHPQLGDVGPAQFIPIAEELGLIQDIGEFIIEEACAALAQWPERMRVSVNFSPLQMRSPALLEVILAALARHGLKPERFEIEVTETVSLEGDTKALAMLEALSAHGMSIALDDFGTGYSSLSYLCTLPVSRVKIDRSFVASIFRTTQSLAVIQAILGLAHSLGMQVVAEGIESRAQFDIVAGHGCEEIQGFLFSKPLSLQAAVQLANNSNSKLRLVA
ncbi:MAG: putative bifunctional diguanylate cyclase/phosphodiesterase, partial [Beijerinckiaceae bacterium]